ncbi:hypothetical protein RSOLAG1IB_09402 [Rhizoctonia solani AG-1 IB]|uniref:Uncharacterized protein n=1 Tax=Thanatephorus cucumeris (strain AG1-IB / isolate 7/3/14) TaxID=1108050 RepID=A0A0B7FV93_THACB|nr:hypothetical protein RSOLAG1IB_09402 [Rhizoctonia solani AG-1 IB]
MTGLVLLCVPPNRLLNMIEFTGSEGLFNLRATFEGAPPQDETICMYATWTEVGAPIIVTPSSVSSVGATTWNLSKYGNPVRWFITKPGEDETKGFHYEKAEPGCVISLGYPSPFFLDLCVDGTGGIFRPATGMNGATGESRYCVGVSEKGTVEIMNVAFPTGARPSPIPAWQARSTPGRWMIPESPCHRSH